jgi:REP element-mobilizing transposase RayT
MTPPPRETQPPHAKSLRAGRWSESFACYAITKCTEGRQPLLAQRESVPVILSSFKHLRGVGQMRVLAFCIMPDHYHVLMFLVGQQSLSEVMASIGKFTARRLNELNRRRGRFWEEGYHDHRCRDDGDIEYRMMYIEHNPVRAGLVTRADDWPFSSANPMQASLLDREWYALMR